MIYDFTAAWNIYFSPGYITEKSSLPYVSFKRLEYVLIVLPFKYLMSIPEAGR